MIGDNAFEYCISLQRICIPSSVASVGSDAFLDCSSLRAVVFCDVIEDFASKDSVQAWWNRGVSELAFKTYGYLVRYRIPERLGTLRKGEWAMNIHAVLERVPDIDSEWNSSIADYFLSIDSKLSEYETMQEVSSLTN